MGLDRVSLVCQTSEIQVLKTHALTQGKCREEFQQCLGGWCGRWSGLELEDLESLKLKIDILETMQDIT